MELIGDDAGDGRANGRIAQLRVERGDAQLRCLYARSCEEAIVGIQRLRAQVHGLFGQSQFIFSRSEICLRGFQIFFRDTAILVQHLAALVSCACGRDSRLRVA